ncbi:hypothetical protein [Candidatus Harpocratesius sp.]
MDNEQLLEKLHQIDLGFSEVEITFLNKVVQALPLLKIKIQEEDKDFAHLMLRMLSPEEIASGLFFSIKKKLRCRTGGRKSRIAQIKSYLFMDLEYLKGKTIKEVRKYAFERFSDAYAKSTIYQAVKEVYKSYF